MSLKDMALIIVDMQNDFVHEDGFSWKYSKQEGQAENPMARLRTPIPNIRKLADTFREKNLEVVYIYTACEADFSDVAMPLRLITAAKEAGALVKGTWGTKIIDELAPHEQDHVVKKHSYDGFFQTPLDRILRNMGKKRLVFTGVNTNFCVETTVREAVAYGYDITLVSDATTSFDPDGHNATLKVIANGFGDVMSTGDVIKLLDQ